MKEKEDILISNWLFDERKEILFGLPLAPTNESFIKKFIHKVEVFTNFKVKFNNVWNTRKIKSLLTIKIMLNILVA